MTTSATGGSAGGIAPARPSATVMLVRDGAAGMEIFMVTRDRPVDGAMGAVVFPGGKVDAEDDIGWDDVATPRPDPHRRYWIAALRETFEEAGLVIGHRAGERDRLIGGAEAAGIAGAHRERLLDRQTTFGEIFRSEGIVPALGHMVHFAHWQTPEHLPKRFDTHFFLVAAPEGQTPTPDGREMVASFWAPPVQILDEVAAGARKLVPATRLNLELLAESRTVGEALAAAGRRKVVTVLPKRVDTPEGPRLVVPPEAGYRSGNFRSSRD